MKFLKKLFGRKSKSKNNECWYNDSHKKKKGRWSTPEAPGAPWSDNSVDNAITMQLAKK